jgi:hypothetical protein
MENNNHFFFKAAFRTHFSLQEGNVLSSGKEYAAFWNKIKSREKEFVKEDHHYDIDYLHDVDPANQMQFESVSDDANTMEKISPQVVQVRPGEWFTNLLNEIRQGIEKESLRATGGHLQYKEGSCCITLFKNTVANLDMLFSVNLKNDDIDEKFIEALESWTNLLSKKLIHYFYHDFLLKFTRKVLEIDEDTGFVSPMNNHYGFPDICEKPSSKDLFKWKAKCAQPSWVSRMLLIDNTVDGFDDLVRRWIITTKSKDDIIEQLKSNGYDEKDKIYLGWLHSLVTASPQSDIFEDAKRALSLTQYYYSVMDSINNNLTRIIGISHEKRSIRETKRYKDLLEEMVFVSNLNKTEFADVTQSMQRNRAFFLKDLIDKWAMDDMFENVERKISLCKENIDKIYQKAFNRSQKVAELLLFFISGFAILEFLKGISEFFWNPENYEDEIWGLYELGRTFDPNSMLWIGISIFLLLFIIYTTIINKQN